MRALVAIVASLGIGCGLSAAGTAHVVDDGGALPPDAEADDAIAPEDATAFDATSESEAPDAAPDAPPPSAGFALSCSGTQYAQMGAVPIPIDFTLEAWVKPAGFAGETYVVAKDRSGQGQGQFRFGFTATGQPFFEMSDASGSDHGLYVAGYVLQSGPIPLNAWSHLAVTKSGAVFNLVVNGVVAKTITASAAFAHGGPAVPFRVAGRVASDGTALSGGFNGMIDEVRLWSVARSAGDIATRMKQPVTASDPQLAAYWRFDEGSGTTTADAKGGFNGTLIGGAKFAPSTAW